MMPIYERRFYLGLLVKKRHDEIQQEEDAAKPVSTGKGARKTKISGNTLKNKLKSGAIPLE